MPSHPIIKPGITQRVGPLKLLGDTPPAAVDKNTPETLVNLRNLLNSVGESWQQNAAFCQKLADVLNNDPALKDKIHSSTQLTFKTRFPTHPTCLSELLNDDHNSVYQLGLLKAFILQAAEAAPASSQRNTPLVAAPSDKKFYDYLQNMAVDIVLQVVQEKVGLGKNGEFAILYKLARGAQEELSSGASYDKITAQLSFQLDNARQGLNKDSAVYGAVNALFQVLDSLRKISLFTPVTCEVLAGTKKATELKTPLSALLNTLPAGGINVKAETLENLLACLDTYRALKASKAPGSEIIKTLVLNNFVPEQFSTPLKIAENLAEKIRSGQLAIKGLPAWPQGHAADVAVASARLAWLMSVLEHPAIERQLDTLLAAEDSRYVRNNLLVFVDAVRAFPAEGSVFQKWEALQSLLNHVPLLAGQLNKMDIRLQSVLGESSDLLKSDTSVMKLVNIAMSTESTVNKSKQLGGLIDYSGVVTKTIRVASEKLLSTLFGPALLLGTKSHEFYNSPYSIGLAGAPRQIYSSVRDFLKEDIKKNPQDYDQLRLGGDVINRLMASVFAASKIKLPANPALSDYLNAYAQAGSKLTGATDWLFRRYLEISLFSKVSRLISRGESGEARQELEALRNMLNKYASQQGYGWVKPLAEILPYIPAITEAANELAAMNSEAQQQMQRALHNLRGELEIKLAIDKNRPVAAQETQQTRQAGLEQLQQQLTKIQERCGIHPQEALRGKLKLLQQTAQAAALLAETKNPKLVDELEALQDTLKTLENAADEPSAVLATLPALQKKLETCWETLGKPVMKQRLETMQLQLSGLQVRPQINDAASLYDWLAQAIVRLATSDKPGIQRVVSELETLARDFCADNLLKLINLTQQAAINLFTREAELSPEETAQGWFILDAKYSLKALLGGAAGGAAAGAALAVGLPWALSKFGVFGDSDSNRPVTINRTVPVDGETHQQLVRLSASQAGVYAPTTLPLPDSKPGSGWKAPGLGAVLGAGAGVVAALALNPAVVAKRSETSDENVINPALSRAGTLHITTDENGITKGIILDGEEKTAPSGDNVATLSRKKRGVGIGFTIRRDEPVALQKAPEVMQISPARQQEIRKNWNEEQILKSTVAPFLENLQRATESRMTKLNASEYIRQYVQNAIDALGDKGRHLTPDSQITVTRTQAVGTGQTSVAMTTRSEVYSLTELVQGKFHGINLEVKWDNNLPYEFRQKILPGSAYGIFTTGDTHSAITTQFEKDISMLERDDALKQGLSQFYKLSFLTTARELAEDAALPRGFKLFLDKVLEGENKLSSLSLNGDRLTDVVAVRIGSHVLAWDSAGSSIRFSDIPGQHSDAAKKWVVDHLNLYKQQEYSTPKNRDEAFVKENNSFKLGSTKSSRLSFAEMDDIGQQSTSAIIERLKEDIDTLVKTKSELLRDNLTDLAFNIVGLAANLVPGSGIAAMILKAAFSGGVTIAQNITAAELADTYDEKTKILSTVLTEVIAGLIVDGIQLGPEMAAKCYNKVKNNWIKESEKVANLPADKHSGGQRLNDVKTEVVKKTFENYKPGNWKVDEEWSGRGRVSKVPIQVEHNGPITLVSTPGNQSDILHMVAHGTSFSESSTTAVVDNMTISFAAPHRASAIHPGYRYVIRNEVTPYVTIGKDNYTFAAYKDPAMTVPVPQEQLRKKLTSVFEKLTLSQNDQDRILATGTLETGKVSNYHLGPLNDLQHGSEYYVQKIDYNRAAQNPSYEPIARAMRMGTKNDDVFTKAPQMDFLFFQLGSEGGSLEQVIEIAKQRGYSNLNATHCRVLTRDRNPLSYETNPAMIRTPGDVGDLQMVEVNIDLRNKKIILSPLKGTFMADEPSALEQPASAKTNTRIHTVLENQNLHTLAQIYYKDGGKLGKLFEANKEQLEKIYGEGKVSFPNIPYGTKLIIPQ